MIALFSLAASLLIVTGEFSVTVAIGVNLFTLQVSVGEQRGLDFVEAIAIKK